MPSPNSTNCMESRTKPHCSSIMAPQIVRIGVLFLCFIALSTNYTLLRNARVTAQWANQPQSISPPGHQNQGTGTTMVHENRRNHEVKAKGDEKSEDVLIYIPNIIEDYNTMFNHAYSVLYRSRTCSFKAPETYKLTLKFPTAKRSVKKWGCRFISTDKKSNRTFTRKGFNHQWLDSSEAQTQALTGAHAVLYPDMVPSDEVPTVGVVPLSIAISSRLAGVLGRIQTTRTTGEFTHLHPIPNIYEPEKVLPGNYMQLYFNTRPTLQTNGAAPDISVSFDPSADVPFSFISSVYWDLVDFSMQLRRTIIGAKPWADRFAGAAMVLPPCSMLHPNQIAYLSKLMDLYPVHSYGDCLRNRDLDGNPVFVINDNHQQTAADKQKQKKFDTVTNNGRLKESEMWSIANSYRYLIVFPDAYHIDVPGYVTEPLFKALTYPTIPVTFGPPDAEKTLFPTKWATLDVRKVYSKNKRTTGVGSQDPKLLVNVLKYYGDNKERWEDKFLGWRSRTLGFTSDSSRTFDKDVIAAAAAHLDEEADADRGDANIPEDDDDDAKDRGRGDTAGFSGSSRVSTGDIPSVANILEAPPDWNTLQKYVSSEFQNLWSISLESTICRICESVWKKRRARSPSFPTRNFKAIKRSVRRPAVI
ncbi:hypothetical protein BJ742DRAFT_419875 [Cladochytrium replicatum]|nr:hypothetical protein BJ742DRAFT_419875 [Cladochytrium replicatum]